MNRHAEDFQALVMAVRLCRACKRMDESERIFGPGSGRTDAPIMFIGEAPGRLGADVSAIPFHGDKAGDNFERLISHVGLTRYDIFITNAVLCNPRDDTGNNASPLSSEVHNCSGFLREQIRLVEPRLVVTLGAKALQALAVLEPHDVQLSTGLRKAWRWNGRTLIALYHPGQRAMIHRSFLNQMGDYQFVAETWKRLNTPRPRRPASTSKTREPIAEIVKWILQASGRLSYFALHKIFYLIEYQHVRETGIRISNAYIVRQKDGPYVTDLHWRRLKLAIDGLNVSRERDSLYLQLAPQHADLFARQTKERSTEVEEFVLSFAARLAKLNDSELKRRAYITAPMRDILQQEKDGQLTMHNSPLDFSVVDRVLPQTG